VDYPTRGNDGGSLDFISGHRSDLEFDKAKRHSARVRALKIALPIFAIVIILGIAAVLVVRQFMFSGIEIANISMNDGKLVMENPNLNGFDDNERPFSLKADRAIQDAANPAVVELEKIFATLPMSEKVSADVIAGNGVYDAEAKTLILRESIQIDTTDGMSISLEAADVDIKNSTMKTLSPITATSPQADISSDTLVVEDGGERLVFEGTVRMTLRPKQSDENEGQNAN
jgi:lipopolysaccharide export system protein LptC